jgi:hypothetical protein
MTAVLEVAIGLGFVYLIFSLVASTIVEWTSAIGDRRAAFLKLALNRSLGETLSADLLKHPVIQGIAKEIKPSWWASLPKPNYLPPKAVALALADLARKPGADPSLVALMAALKNELPAVSPPAIAIDGEVLFRIEHWFTEQMARTTAGYKRWTQLWTIALALLLTIAFDIDAGRMTNHLLSNAAVRTALAATASNEVASKTLAEIQPSAATLAALPVGWTRPVPEALGNGGLSTFATFAGWAISIIAIGLGAPFWFDLLNRLVSLRQTGPKPADKTFEG